MPPRPIVLLTAVAVGCGGQVTGTMAGTSGSISPSTVASGASAASNTGASTGYGTFQDCVAAGGQCLADGGGGLCAKEGPANTCDCNLGCNSSGAICCLEFVDGGEGTVSQSTDAADSSAEASCDATPSSMPRFCPSLASSCPCGCYVVANPERYDRMRGCLEPWSSDVNVCSTNQVSLAVVSCWVRIDTGDAYLFNGTPLSATLLGNGWQPCTQTDRIPTDGGYGPPTCP
jgi:hypothetical protein